MPTQQHIIKIQTFLLCSILIGLIQCREIILSKQNDNYVFKANIGNLNMNLNPVLSLQRKHTWIKAEDCKYCQLISSQNGEQKDIKGIEKIDDKMYDCSKSCFDKAQDQYGLKCVETHNKCKVFKDNFEVSIDSSKKAIGKLIEVKIQAKSNDEKFDHFQTVLVQKIISLQPVQQTPKANQKKQAPQSTINSIGQYMIWGSTPLFQNNIITKNSKQQLVVYDGLTQNNLEKQLLADVSPIDIEFQQTVTQFTLSQVKLSEKITVNHPEKVIEDHEIPILPLQKGFITLDTQNLLLPKKHYQKLIDHLLPTYFATENNKCEFKDSKISCQKSLTLDKVEFLQLQLILNGISIGFPFKTLIKNCKSKSCDLRVSQSPNQSSFSLGTFFFQIFALEFVEQTENIKLHRLNNQWNSFYSKDQKYHKANFNIFWWIGSSFFYAIYYILKIIFYLALFSLVVNFIYHWRKILQWGSKICERIRRKKGSEESSELFEHDEDLEAKDTAKLIRRFKNRRKVFVEDQQQSLNDEITTQESN